MNFVFRGGIAAGRLFPCALALFLAACSDSGGGGSGGLTDSTGTVSVLGEEVLVFAWSELGMNEITATYDQIALLPPGSSLWAQVVRRGNPPEIVTAGLVVEYRVIDNTFSYGKRSYAGFWDTAAFFYGAPGLPRDVGLYSFDRSRRATLSGIMTPVGGHFEAAGIPVTPVLDDGTWSPYQVAEITVKDGAGAVLATTRATLPVSDEVNCGRCHTNGPTPFADILARHDALHGSDLQSYLPVICATCHASPALGATARLNGTSYLSEAIHRSHADRGATCYDCHPGAVTRMSRSVPHGGPDGGCTNTSCHGTMAGIASTITSGSRIPWVNEPLCATCHGRIHEVDTGGVLFRNASGHGDLSCAVCHGGSHAWIPSEQAADNGQAVGVQSVAKTIGTCSPCHDAGSKGQSPLAKFAEAHGGTSPGNATTCNVCHTAVSDDYDRWPHGFSWHNRP